MIATALLFSLLHFQYGPAEWTLIALDGIGFGLARAWTGSVPLTFVMHAMGNCYAFLERVL